MEQIPAISTPLRPMAWNVLARQTIDANVNIVQGDFMDSSVNLASLVDGVIRSRRSIRAFLPREISRDVLNEILAVASRAPSGANVQPWKVHVLTGESLRKLSSALLAVHNAPDGPAVEPREFDYYPSQWVEPYIGRRRKVGFDLYRVLGIARGEQDRMHAQAGHNYAFFGAPVGMIFTIDRILGQGSWLDYGLFLQNVMICARARGLDTCPQAAFIEYHNTVSQTLDLAANEMLVCGMSLGYADPDAASNRLETEREPVSAFTTFHD